MGPPSTLWKRLRWPRVAPGNLGFWPHPGPKASAVGWNCLAGWAGSGTTERYRIFRSGTPARVCGCYGQMNATPLRDIVPAGWLEALAESDADLADTPQAPCYRPPERLPRPKPGAVASMAPAERNS